MFKPFMFIAINRIRPGKFGDEKRRVPVLCDFIEATEPQLIAFDEYASEDGTEVGVVHIHRDAASIEFRMEVVADRAAQVYRKLSEAALKMLERQARRVSS
jgi:hypothetical protein